MQCQGVHLHHLLKNGAAAYADARAGALKRASKKCAWHTLRFGAGG
ncbi:hypothetical protein KDH_74670 [Dictyobacter sp. S3.2.2.5]|uniref:Uncharacterized protein n=1 Tax=Dictyobacter halimunensis TaxID=3026934 RepID=A0ABQ6G4B1_9CHLR|nr:hypothetical protein KDH_74670 [Dictyobacter sp. S3.2.2.5]